MMTTLPEKGDPVVLTTATVDMRVVKLSLGNTSRCGDDRGTLFMPERLFMQWRDGKLDAVGLSGRALRSDGNPWLSAKSATRTFLPDVGDMVLAEDTPGWVLDLIKKHQP